MPENMYNDEEYSPHPWTLRFCDGLSLQYVIIDANGDMVAMGEFHYEADMLAFLRIFTRNSEFHIDAKSLESMKNRRFVAAVERDIILGKNHE